jgi:hypothetical protein
MKKIPGQSLGTVGQCIYCFTDCKPLTEEHIIPLGLNGPWKLLEASCRECATITSKFERSVLKTTFGTVRIAMDFPSRRKKSRPNELPLSIEKEGSQQEVYIPVEDYPAVLQMPHLEAPGHLSGSTDTRLRVNGATGVQIGGPPIVEVGKKLSAQRILTHATFEPVGAFARLLAKIAYGCAVGALGCDLNQFDEVYVLPVILGRSDEIGRWVGGVNKEQPAAESDLHKVKFFIIDRELRVHVRLFAQYSAPEYVVVVGRISFKLVSELKLPKEASKIYADPDEL